MSAARPFVSVYSAESSEKTEANVPMPGICVTAIRPDHVRYIHTQMRKNSRQAYAVSMGSGYQSSAESWGTGRAVARIPRVSGGGTHRAGQGAFGNMCRGGSMYSATRTWRRWHRRINITEKRHAVCSAVAASSVPAIVSARGHRIDAVPEIPLVVSDDILKFEKTKQAMKFLERFGCGEELKRVRDSKTIRSGKGRNRRSGSKYTISRGPLIIYSGQSDLRAFKNIPGVELQHVSKLNLLQLAPGGSLGRFCIWTQSAFQAIDNIWHEKSQYVLPRSVATNSDIARIINSNEVQSVLRPAKEGNSKPAAPGNPLKNRALKLKLNPCAVIKNQ